MTIGMMTFSFDRMIGEGRIDVPGIVRFCAELGLDAIEVTERHWLNPDEDIPATVEALKETGLSVACCNTSLDLVRRGREAKAKRERRLHDLFDRLEKVNCSIVMLGSVTNDLSPEEWRRQFGIGLAEAASVAEDYGITVTFENRGGSMGLMVGTVEHCLQIIEYADDPRLRLTFDVGNFRYVGGDSVEAFDQLADMIVHVHLKDVVPRDDSFEMVPLGEGEVDNAIIIHKLVERGYTGCLAIECGGRGTDLEDARRSAEFVKNTLMKL
jgi:sugar phosphate isomerase/epimerase